MPRGYENWYVEKGSVDSADMAGKEVCEAYHGYHRQASYEEELEGGLFLSRVSLPLH